MPTLEASYSKKIGLPGFSSHAFSVTVRTEIDDVSQVEKLSNQFYSQLQDAVDRNLENGEGFIPEAANNGPALEPSRNGNNGSRTYRNNGASQSNGRPNPPSRDYWKCSDRQRELINKIVDDHRLDFNEVEDLADQMFQTAVKSLNKLQASNLIAELLDKYGQASNGNGNRNGGRSYQRGRR